jgi:hypothetical protein
LAAKASAAAVTLGDACLFVIGLAALGFNGNGGGARSGSELSHLFTKLVHDETVATILLWSFSANLLQKQQVEC